MRDEPVSQETIEYRKNNLEHMLDRIRDAISGRNESFLPFVEDKTGKLNNRKIAAFINELTSFDPELKEYSPQNRQCLKLFLYCAIVGPSVKSRVHDQVLENEYVIPKTFAELIEAARDPIFTEIDRSELIRDEEYARTFIEMGEGFSFFLNCMYTDLTGRSSRELYHWKDLQKAAEEYAELMELDADEVFRCWKNQIGEKSDESNADSVEEQTADRDNSGDKLGDSNSSEENNGAASGSNGFVQKIGPLVISPTMVSWDSLSEVEKERIAEDLAEAEKTREENEGMYHLPEPDWESIEKEKDWYHQLCANSMEEYKQHLPENHKLIENYAELRKKLSAGIPWLAKQLELMVDGFLARHEMGPLYFRYGYGKIAGHLTKCLDEIEQDADRLRRYQ